MANQIWATATCPVCGLSYKYLADALYKPHTCLNYDCVHAFIHHPQYQDLMRMIDAERIRAFNAKVEVYPDV